MIHRSAGIITAHEAAGERLTGCTRDEADRRAVQYLSHCQQRDPNPPHPGTGDLAQGTVQGLANHTVLIARNGSECDIADNCAPIHDRDGKVIGAVLVFRDVTGEYAAQQALRDSTQALQEKNVELESARSVAEKANLAKSDFLSSMSHELRSPLNAILGFAQLMESGSPPPTPSQKASIDQILQAGWYLLELINEILDLALIESGKLSLSLEPMSLAEVMLECQAMIEPQAQKRGISMSFPQFDIPYFVHADRTRVKQVLINLLSNAIKYNRAQGTVDVTCSASSRRTHPHQRAGHRRRIASGKAGATFPAVQSSRTRGRRRGRHRHRPGGEQAAGRTDGGRDRRGKHGRGGQCVLVRTEPGG